MQSNDLFESERTANTSLFHSCPLLTCSLHERSLWSQILLCGFLQAEQHDIEQGEEGGAKPNCQEAGKKLPPYTLKVANLLGDVRLQNCPSPEGQDVLYFTAQWEHDGGGVYDIAKFTQPEVTHIPAIAARDVGRLPALSTPNKLYVCCPIAIHIHCLGRSPKTDAALCWFQLWFCSQTLQVARPVLVEQLLCSSVLMTSTAHLNKLKSSYLVC